MDESRSLEVENNPDEIMRCRCELFTEEGMRGGLAPPSPFRATKCRVNTTSQIDPKLETEMRNLFDQTSFTYLLMMQGPEETIRCLELKVSF